MLTPEEGKSLLKVARSAIECYFRKRPLVLPKEQAPTLWERRGAFVTLNDAMGNLRGCIGRVESKDPLIQTVSQMAVEAAFNDPRFLPLREEELPTVSLEVSALSPLSKIRHEEELEVGRDGLLIQRGFASGLLLPQVATENRWTREEFLSYACIKAGLPGQAWKEKETEIYRFTAEIFSEGAHRG